MNKKLPARRLRSIAVLSVFVVSCKTTSEVSRTVESFSARPERSPVRKIADDVVYRGLMELLPEAATRQGVHEYDRRLSDPSPAGWKSYGELLKGALARLEAIDSASLDDPEKLEYELLVLWLRTQTDGLPYRGIDFLLDPLHGFHLSLPRVFGDMRYRHESDYEVAIERLAAIPAYVEGVTASLREQMAAGRFEARPVVEKVIAQFEMQLAMDVEEHPFFAPFTKFPESITENQRGDLGKEALDVLTQRVLPAWAGFHAFLEGEYRPKARADVGIWATPNGAARYAWCAKHYTTTDLTPDRIHEIGLAEVARIRSEMEEIKKRVEFEGDLAAFFQFLRTDERFYYTEPEELLRGYRDICKRADAALPPLFGKLPRAPYGVIPIPDFAAVSATTAYYEVPPAEGGKPGYFYANTYKLEMRPKYEMEALALHEAVPGHHTQLALQLELEDVSDFRTRWLEFTAFVEGWALYAERLGIEMGFYTDPYSDFGRLTYEMWRACRLVVDTGMHAKKWSREHAIQFMLDNTALTQLNVESEIDRYITWPGQALAYKIGELKIRELRARAEKELHTRFDVRAFHDLILEQGSIPLSMLEQRVDRWIRQTPPVRVIKVSP